MKSAECICLLQSALKTLSALLCQEAFNNYVDQILPNFDPLPPSSGETWTFYIISILYHVTPMDFLLTPYPPSSSTQIMNDPFSRELVKSIHLRNHSYSSLTLRGREGVIQKRQSESILCTKNELTGGPQGGPEIGKMIRRRL